MVRTPPPKLNTTAFKEYADSIGVDVDDLSASITAGCYREDLESVRRGAVIHGVGREYRRSSTRANHRSLKRAGILSTLHNGLRHENVDWVRFDALTDLRERIK